VPLVVADELHQARAYHDYRERCLFCDMLSQELAAGARLVGETPEVVAFAPFAARFPYETWILPRRHAAAFETTSPETLRDLARLVRSVLGRLDRAIGDPPYNLFLHSAPFGTEVSPSYHWHVEIVPKLVGVAGFEWGSGFHINPMPPEDAARTLRNTPE
jgi:UDPglucose--hexose-1-phosphate uridylyltransferase